MYYMRWGDPDFVRAYLTNLPDLSKIAGFYMGPDGYTWGREFVSTEPDTPRQLVIEKMWFGFMLWGRLAYDPTIPNSHFEQMLAARFPDRLERAIFRRLDVGVEDPAADDALLLGRSRLQVVSGGELEPDRLRDGPGSHHAEVRADAS